jgi:Tfp pilus assembly protein PilV
MIELLIALAIGVVGILGALLYKIVNKARKSEHFDEDNKHIKG